ncbi:MAG: hypothetical protein WBD46_18955 [Acidobacteriaceae bacterium]
MKSVVQALVLGIVAVGASAAIGSSYQTTALPSHQTVVSAYPMPGCSPGRPCPGNGGSGN